ncbi:MAG: hypothetical protein ACYC4U_07235 [Pirellulaceae bacterium]
MRQLKIFKSIESELWNMEKEINHWVKEAGVEVISVTGNISPQTSGSASHGFSSSDVLIVVLYESGD